MTHNFVCGNPKTLLFGGLTSFNNIKFIFLRIPILCVRMQEPFFVENIDFFSETGNPKKMSGCLWSTLVVLGDFNSHHRRQYNLTLQSRWNDNQYSVEDVLNILPNLGRASFDKGNITMEDLLMSFPFRFF